MIKTRLILLLISLQFISITSKTLSTPQGFFIIGSAGFFGKTVSSAGDVNGDGYPDILIGQASLADGYDQGSYALIVYGGPTSSFISNITADKITPQQGFRIWFPWNQRLLDVRSTDINKDGYSDLILGAYDLGYKKIYVVYGSAAPVDIKDITKMKSSQGFTMTCDYTFSDNHISLATVGDVNGDGYPDLAFGDGTDTTNETLYGFYNDLYIIYGGKSLTSFNLSNMTTTQGFKTTIGPYNFYVDLTNKVRALGDVNKDGYDDIALGGKVVDSQNNFLKFVYVIYGGENLSKVNISSMTPSQGFIITAAGDLNYQADFAKDFAGIGDVNGDGYADIAVSAAYGQGYAGIDTAFIIYGGPSLSNVNISTISASQGFRIAKRHSYSDDTSDEEFGGPMAAAGDFNGDGYADFVVSCPGAYGEAGMALYQRGLAYVIYGGRSLKSFDIDDLTSAQGVKFGSPSDLGNDMGEISSVGDINKDGYADLVAGITGEGGSYGVAYVIFGGPNA